MKTFHEWLELVEGMNKTHHNIVGITRKKELVSKNNNGQQILVFGYNPIDDIKPVKGGKDGIYMVSVGGQTFHIRMDYPVAQKVMASFAQQAPQAAPQQALRPANMPTPQVTAQANKKFKIGSVAPMSSDDLSKAYSQAPQRIPKNPAMAVKRPNT